MNRLYRTVVVASAIVLVGAASACSSGSTSGKSGDGGAGGSSGGGSGSGGGGGACSLAVGMYTQHYTLEAGGTSNCMPMADRTTPIDSSNQTPTPPNTADSGAMCTSSQDTSTCTFSGTCSESFPGLFTIQVTYTFTVSGNSLTGKYSSKSTDSSGMVVQNCTYDLTETKI
jgi:hypothetical protein